VNSGQLAQAVRGSVEQGSENARSHELEITLLSRVDRGDELLITKRSKPVAVLIPLSAAAADAGTASGHQSCNRGDGTRATLGARPRELSRAMKCTSDHDQL
jgi:antitoxin (DNA-binding transcriptional repressor) of toxin-antitoxin stability system